MSPMAATGAPVKTRPRKWVLVVEDNARLRALWIEVLGQLAKPVSVADLLATVEQIIGPEQSRV